MESLDQGNTERLSVLQSLTPTKQIVLGSSILSDKKYKVFIIPRISGKNNIFHIQVHTEEGTYFFRISHQGAVNETWFTNNSGLTENEKQPEFTIDDVIINFQ